MSRIVVCVTDDGSVNAAISISVPVYVAAQRGTALKNSKLQTKTAN